MKVHLTVRDGTARLLIDGVDVSRHVAADDLEVDLRGQVPTVRLTILPSELDIELVALVEMAWAAQAEHEARQ